MGLISQKGGFFERETFRTLDADRMDRFNVFILLCFLFNFLVVRVHMSNAFSLKTPNQHMRTLPCSPPFCQHLVGYIVHRSKGSFGFACGEKSRCKNLIKIAQKLLKKRNVIGRGYKFFQILWNIVHVVSFFFDLWC